MHLVDACVLVVLKDERRKKPRWVLKLFDDRPELLSVSAMTIWEIELKAARRPRVLPAFWEPAHASLQEELEGAGISLVPFTAEMATRAARLPMHHKDPFDRALIATALTLNAPIISFDRQLARYEGVDLRWD
jgi:PIN domain nuclease of toxin-antitoxin system